MNINIVIPMSGGGSRFSQNGHLLPKPLIEVREEVSMVEMVVRNLAIKGTHIFLVLKDHYEKYQLKQTLERIVEKPVIIIVDQVTQGTTCTVLLAKKYIDNNTPLFIANADQFIEEWSFNDFNDRMISENLDGGIPVFTASDASKWSFAKLDENGFVTEVAEKKAISNIATCGLFWFNKGSEFVQYAEQMIRKNIRHNNEFYLCPVYNELIADAKKIKTYPVQTMWGTGTPADLNYFIENYKGKI